MGVVASSPAQCIDNCVPSNSRNKWLEERCAALALENEKLHQQLRKAGGSTQSSTPGGSNHAGNAFMRSPTNDSITAITRRGSSGMNLTPTVSRKDSSSGMAAMAVAAAAEATAQYQSSLVHVEVDNEKEANATHITVRAPTRPYLLGDLTGALSGLGLAVLSAALSKVTSFQSRAESPRIHRCRRSFACTSSQPYPRWLAWAELPAPARPLTLAQVEGSASTAVLHFTLQDGGRKVNDKDRLRSIEQRLQQRFCGRQGLNGGVRRLVVERFLRAEAPWKHEVLELAPPPPAEEQVEACRQ